jgi:nitrogenase molybdenum-cofactor synthesis protein NifE
MTIEPRTLQAPASIGATLCALALRDALGVLHGGAGCDIKLHTLLHHHNPSGDVHRRVICTKITESELVLDPGELLAAAVQDLVRRTDPRLVIVTSAAFVEVAGLDHAHIVSELEERLGIPAVYVYAPDFIGNLFDGYAEALSVVTERFTRELSPGRDRGGRVNLAGYVLDRPYLEHQANLSEAARMLSGVGLTLNATLLDGSPVRQLALLPEAELVAALPDGQGAAAHLSERLDQVVVPVEVPMGTEGSRRWLVALAEAGGAAARARRFADEEADRVRALVRQAAEPLSGKRVALFADAPKLKGLLHLCRDLQLIPTLAGALDGRADLLEDHGWPRLEILDDPGQVTVRDRLAAAGEAQELDLVIGSAHEARLARLAKIPSMEFGFPCRGYQAIHPVPYWGFSGVTAMAMRALEAMSAKFE